MTEASKTPTECPDLCLRCHHGRHPLLLGIVNYITEDYP